MTPPHRDIAGQAADFVQLVREFLKAYCALTDVLARYPAEPISFATIRSLAGEDDRAVLFRLKRRSHALFRGEAPASESVRREALFDLAVGSLFHEAMKLRESLYHREVYAPRVTLLRDASIDTESEALFAEFDRILERSEIRSNEVVSEIRILLAQSRDQLRRLLVERADTRAVTRCLLSRRAEVDIAFPEGFVGLLEAMHGDAASGFVQAARALLESAHFGEAVKTLREAAREHGAPRSELDPLERYAEGMQAVLDEDYRLCVSSLEVWIELGGHVRDRGFARLACAVLGRLGGLVADEPIRDEITARAKELQLRLETASG